MTRRRGARARGRAPRSTRSDRPRAATACTPARRAAPHWASDSAGCRRSPGTGSRTRRSAAPSFRACRGCRARTRPGCRCRAPRTAGRSRGRARRGARAESAPPPAPRWPARAPGLTCRRPRRPARPRGGGDRARRAAVVSSRQASAVALAEPGSLSYAPAVALIALGYHLASRLAYVLYIGTMLRRQERSGYFTGRYGAEAGFRRFRRAAFLLMSNDAVSFVVLCLVSRRTLGQPSAAAIAAGVLLLLVGIATTLWARATLGGGPAGRRRLLLAQLLRASRAGGSRHYGPVPIPQESDVHGGVPPDLRSCAPPGVAFRIDHGAVRPGRDSRVLPAGRATPLRRSGQPRPGGAECTLPDPE